MILILCLDDEDGMMFGGRRQSRDKVLRARILRMAGGKNLWMNRFSAGQFEKTSPSIRIDENPLERAAPGDFCFAEDLDITGCGNRTEKIIIYRWNRAYPSDRHFEFPEFRRRFILHISEDFKGSSHDRITEEVYLPR